MSKGIKTYLAKKKNMRKNVSSKMQNKRFNRNTKRVGNKKWGGDDDYGDIEEVETGEEKIVGFKLVEKNQKDNTNATDATDATNAIDATDATDAEPTTNIATNKPTAVPTTPPANRFTPGKDDKTKANEEIRAAVNELKEKEKYKNYKTAKNSDKSDVWNKGVIGDWDVSNVTNMSNLFIDFYEFNEPLNAWDVSNVTNMAGMFSGCTNFNQPLDNWKVTPASEMMNMFANCKNFNQPSIIEKWNLLYMPNGNKDDMFKETPMENINIINNLYHGNPNNIKENEELCLYIRTDNIPQNCAICNYPVIGYCFYTTKCNNRIHYKCLFGICNKEKSDIENFIPHKCNCPNTSCNRILLFPEHQIGIAYETRINNMINGVKNNGWYATAGKTKRRSKKNQRKTRRARKNKK